MMQVLQCATRKNDDIVHLVLTKDNKTRNVCILQQHINENPYNRLIQIRDDNTIRDFTVLSIPDKIVIRTTYILSNTIVYMKYEGKIYLRDTINDQNKQYDLYKITKQTNYSRLMEDLRHTESLQTVAKLMGFGRSKKSAKKKLNI